MRGRRNVARPGLQRAREVGGPADGAFGSWTYPSVLVLDDRVIISHRYFDYREDPEKSQLNKSNPKDDSAGFIQVQKVLPLSWFYGGKEPADNPTLPRSAAR